MGVLAAMAATGLAPAAIVEEQDLRQISDADALAPVVEQVLADNAGKVDEYRAGNAIEKNLSTVTIYQVQVRMEDGSLRMVEQGSAPAIGSAVIVEAASMRPNDGSLHPGNGAAAMAPAAPQAKVYSTDGR